MLLFMHSTDEATADCPTVYMLLSTIAVQYLGHGYSRMWRQWTSIRGLQAAACHANAVPLAYVWMTFMLRIMCEDCFAPD